MLELLVGVEDLLRVGRQLKHHTPCWLMEYSLQPFCFSPDLDSLLILVLALPTLAETPAQAVLGC